MLEENPNSLNTVSDFLVLWHAQNSGMAEKHSFYTTSFNYIVL